MSIDKLHEKIRKMKNPSVIDFGIKPDALPNHLLKEEGSASKAYFRFCNELLDGLLEIVPAVRFSFGAFALLGSEGLVYLQKLLKTAGEKGYYVILDAPELLSPWAADRISETIYGTDTYPCDATLICPYIGSDAVKPFIPYCKEGKALFVAVRSPNKTAAELQDLLTGTRHVYSATAEMVARCGETILAKCAYSQIGAVAAASSPESLRQMRLKHNRTFLLVDGLDYPSGNAKNCSYAFDRFGYGAAVCAGPSVTAAWKTEDVDDTDYIAAAVDAAQRMKKNITRYITIL